MFQPYMAIIRLYVN